MYITVRRPSFHSPYFFPENGKLLQKVANTDRVGLREAIQTDFDFVFQFLKFDTVCPNIEL
jgi:hypothetical protein